MNDQTVARQTIEVIGIPIDLGQTQRGVDLGAVLICHDCQEAFSVTGMPPVSA